MKVTQIVKVEGETERNKFSIGIKHYNTSITNNYNRSIFCIVFVKENLKRIDYQS